MNDILSPTPQLRCFREYADAPPIVPGRPDRVWMDDTAQRFAYRCTPLSIANSSGWDIQLPIPIMVTWNGGNLATDLTISAIGYEDRLPQVATSAFGHGVLTFHPGYLFKTSPGWAVVARGAPNTVKDGIVPLDGLIETDWLPLTFTMNWRFTRPTTVKFEVGETFCHINMIPHAILDDIAPTLENLDDDLALKNAYETWRASRIDFNARLVKNEPEAVKEGWQKNYIMGRDPSGTYVPSYHLTKRKLKAPR